MHAREEGTRARTSSFLSHRARYSPSWIAPPLSILEPKNISCPCHRVGIESWRATRASNAREYIKNGKNSKRFSVLNWKVLKKNLLSMFHLCNLGANQCSFEQRTNRSWKTRERGKAMAAQGEKGNNLLWRGSQTPVSNVCEAAPRSLFWVPRRTQRITGSAFRISFQPDWLIDKGIFNRPITPHSQILVHRWGPRTRILVLFRRRTYPEFSFVSSAG